MTVDEESTANLLYAGTVAIAALSGRPTGKIVSLCARVISVSISSICDITRQRHCVIRMRVVLQVASAEGRFVAILQDRAGDQARVVFWDNIGVNISDIGK